MYLPILNQRTAEALGRWGYTWEIQLKNWCGALSLSLGDQLQRALEQESNAENIGQSLVKRDLWTPEGRGV